MFLVLLSNDKAVLGPWVNSTARNVVSGLIVWVLVLLSVALTVATIFPHLTGVELIDGLSIGMVVGVLGGLFIIVRWRSKRSSELDTLLLQRHDKDGLTKLRETWRMPKLDKLPQAEMSIGKKLGLGTLRAYLVLAFVVVIVKIVQLAMGH